MPFLRDIHIDKGRILLWKLSDTDDFRELAEREKDNLHFKQRKHSKRKTEYLAARALLMLADILPEQITYKETGQPIVLNAEYKHISISHSNEIVAVCLHVKAKVGIDVEDKNRNFGKAASKFFNKEEQELMLNADMVAVLWGAKEAVYKAVSVLGVSLKDEIVIKEEKGNLYAIHNRHDRCFRIDYLECEDQQLVWAIED